MDIQMTLRSFSLEIFLELHETSGRDILTKDREVGLSACHRAALPDERRSLLVAHVAVEGPGAFSPAPAFCDSLDVGARDTGLKRNFHHTSFSRSSRYWRNRS